MNNDFYDELPHLSREVEVLADRFDSRVDLLAGLRNANLAPAANLRMTASLTAFDDWKTRIRSDQGTRITLTHATVVAALQVLGEDPLFACQFDGRDRLEHPSNPSIGISVDSGDFAETAVIQRAGEYSLEELVRRIDNEVEKARLRGRARPSFRNGRLEKVAAQRTMRRWQKIFWQELCERFDYLVPSAQTRRLNAFAEQHGNFCIHNVGTLGDVHDFKAFLRRPAVAELWLLSAIDEVVPTQDGGFRTERRVPLHLVFTQEIVTEARACRFLKGLVKRLEAPESLKRGTA